MGTRCFTIFGVLIIIFLFGNNVRAQSLSVVSGAFDDYYRSAQLLGEVDSTVSFMVRPLYPSLIYKRDDAFNPLDTALHRNLPFTNNTITLFGQSGKLQILPLSLKQQYNSARPYGWNDGAMIPAKGYQVMISAGAFFKYGPFSVQFNPEIVFAQNTSFKGFSGPELYPYTAGIDMPERFGSESYSKLFPGQSSVRLTVGPASLGLSSENIWWGPGRRNSLILSNNAPGFYHLTLNTVKPVKTPVGFFEAQILGGRLENSDIVEKPEDWRYLSGLIFSYQPKWVPGLFLGLTRAFQMYHKDVDGLSDYIPLFQAFQKEKTNENDVNRDQLSSVFARWLWKEENAEIYFEYGRNDHAVNLRDFLMEPDHSRAYVLGLSKIIPLKGKRLKEFIEINAEVTQLETTETSLVREFPIWYIHYQIPSGYTNRGQVLGAGIGPASNLQSLQVSWFNGLKKLGVQIERYVHNNDYYNAIVGSSNGAVKPWVDFSTGIQGAWDYKNTILSGGLNLIRSKNYQWRQQDYNAELDYIRTPDLYNLQIKLGAMYRF